MSVKCINRIYTLKCYKIWSENLRKLPESKVCGIPVLEWLHFMLAISLYFSILWIYQGI